MVESARASSLFRAEFASHRGGGRGPLVSGCELDRLTILIVGFRVDSDPVAGHKAVACLHA